VIRKGITLTETEEFLSYKRTYQNQFPLISQKISQLEEYFAGQNVRVANVDGKKLILLLGKNRLTPEECVSCLVNMHEVADYLKMIRLKYLGKEGRIAAAAYVQKIWRGY
jgi:hypothetical protein